MSPTSARKRDANAASAVPKSEQHGYEFGGPLGAAAITFLLPILCYAFAFLCNDVSGCPVPSLLHPRDLFSASPLTGQSGWQHGLTVLAKEAGWPGFTGLINTQAVLGTAFWYLLSLALNKVLPASEVQGTELRTGGKLTYRFNAFSSAVCIMSACALGTFIYGAEFPVWTFINANYVQLLTCNIIIAYSLASYVYIRSFSVKPGNKDKRELALGGHSGNLIYDYYIGRELNPRVTLPYFGELDIKSFMELRPGMLGWIILDCAFMATQYRRYGYVTDSMLVVTIAQAVYTFDALWMEPAVLTTMDLITDGFGFMLSFGDLVWVPFIYSLQARYLSVHPVILGPVFLTLILGVQGLGYYIFRASNNEKNRFRTDPNDPRVAHLSFIDTKRGTRLITSGWWGTARHINYLGDWLMSWSFSLPTLAAGYKLIPSILSSGGYLVSTNGMKGWAIPVTYFYLLYFAVLLVHREMRDEENCRRKYGKDWDRYCEIVRWRIVPGIY